VEDIAPAAVKRIGRVFWFWALASTLSGAPTDWAPSLTATATWNSNVTNANRSPDIIGDLQLGADAAVSHRFALGAGDAVFLGAQIEGDASPRFDRLDRAALGPRLAWRHKFGLGAFASAFSLELAGDAALARESDRNGVAGSATLAWRKRLDPATRVAWSAAWTRQDAREALFARTGTETAAEIAHDFDERWTVAADVRWRDGTVLAYATPPRPDLVALARDHEPYDTFDRPFMAYSLTAHTLGGSLALSRAVGPSTACTLRYEWRQTERGPLRYMNHLVSASLARQF
jgi:hypothetical protein